MELRRRVVDFVEDGHSYREAAERFRVSAGFVNDTVRLKWKTGFLDAGPQGTRGPGRLSGVMEWARERMAKMPKTTLDELTAVLREEHSIEVHRFPVGRLLHRLDLSHKKRRQGQRSGARGSGESPPAVDAGRHREPRVH